MVDEVLQPPWLEGMRWTLEVHGKARHFGVWAPFWGKAYYQVLKVNGKLAEVIVDFHPEVRKLGGRAPERDKDDFDDREVRWILKQTYGDGVCFSRMELSLPWSLAYVELRESIDRETDPRRLKVSGFGLEAPPRTGTSPCIPLVPRHPTLQPSEVAVPKSPQSIEVTADAVRFTLYEDTHTRITWVKGQPWWALMEKVASSKTAPTTVDERRPDNLQVFRARLIEINRKTVEPLPWTSDEHWLRDNWPSGGMDERELPPFGRSAAEPPAAPGPPSRETGAP